MNDPDKKAYELEEPSVTPSREAGAAPSDDAANAGASVAAEAARGSVAPEPPAIAALDVCPACGAALGDIDKLVCIRCGFDLKTNQPLKTKVASDEVTVIVDVMPNAIAPPGLGGAWLPIAIAAASALVLTIACFWGAPGLVRGENITILTKLTAWFRLLASTALLAGCGVAALAVLARISGRPLGPWRLAGWRMLALVAVTALILMLNITFWPGELTVESALRAAAFVCLAMLAFNLDLREAATLLGIQIACVLGLLAVAAGVLWVMTP